MKKERVYEKLDDFKRACKRLDEATKLEPVNDIVFDGVIQRFEFTFELSWKLLKLHLEFTGIGELRSPRAIIREAYAAGIIDNGDEWISMMEDRNKTSHIYDEEEAKIIYLKIVKKHNTLLNELAVKLEQEMAKIK
ncbi:nucleotidyltransferase substrate binding protein [Neobacillus sp. SM06]|uniref:nucleotidyltransferase substrate binding protein n=1 Tax=Neobacillus sp. SM06 TaxID=3422492 RepID=UPI003D2BB860